MKTLKKIFGKSEQLEKIEYSKVLTPEEQAEEQAQQAIVKAYNDCVTDLDKYVITADDFANGVRGKSMTADDFAIKLFSHLITESKDPDANKMLQIINLGNISIKITDTVNTYVSCRILSQFNYREELTLESFVKNSLEDNTNQKDHVFKLNLTPGQKNSIETKATEAKKTPEEILTGEIQFALQVDGVFKALHSQYGNNEIKDNLAKVEKDPTTWEIIKNFINEYLLAGLFQTNVNDKERYKAHKESFTEKVIQSQQNGKFQQIS